MSSKKWPHQNGEAALCHEVNPHTFKKVLPKKKNTAFCRAANPQPSPRQKQNPYPPNPIFISFRDKPDLTI